MQRGWESIKYDEERELHTVPLNDDYDHEHTICCDCNPRIERVNGWIIICHNSFDGREAVEWAEEIINST